MMPLFRTLLWVLWARFLHRFESVRNHSFGQFLLVLMLCIVSFGLFVLAVTGGVGGWALGKLHLESLEQGEIVSDLIVISVLDVAFFYFMIFWLTDIMVELQRSEPVDFRRLLYLPISLRSVFLLNFGLSLISPLMFIFMMPVITFAMVSAFVIGPQMLLVIPLGGLCYIMISAWTYYFTGLIAFVVQSKRKRQMAIMAISFIFIIPIFAFSFTSNTRDYDEDRQETPTEVAESKTDTEENIVTEVVGELSGGDYGRNQVILANSIIPLGWYPLGVGMILAENYFVVFQCLAGLTALSGFGLYFGYQSTLRFYTSPSGSRRRIKKIAGRASLGQRILDLRIPVLPEQSAMVAKASFLNLMRHPMVMGMLIPIVVFGGGFIVFQSATVGDEVNWQSSLFTELSPAAVVMIPFMSLVGLYTNMFGMDIGGFRAYVIMPVSRSKYLLGINSMLVFVSFMISFSILLISSYFVPLSISKFFISILQIIQLSLTFCIIGNFFSIYFPYYMDMRGTRPGFRQQLIMVTAGFAIMLLLGIMSLPVSIAMLVDAVFKISTGYEGISIGLVVSGFMVIAVAVAYAVTLPYYGRVLQEREVIILNRLIKMKP